VPKLKQRLKEMKRRGVITKYLGPEMMIRRKLTLRDRKIRHFLEYLIELEKKAQNTKTYESSVFFFFF
jgi:hypothetical protein